MLSSVSYRSLPITRLFFGCLLLSGSTVAHAQKRYSYNSQVWTSYFTNLRISNRWWVNADASLRTRDHLVEDMSQLLFRAGLGYNLSGNVRATAGYVYSEFYPNEVHPLSKRIEHRPYQLLQWMTESGRYRFTQTGRLEQRFRQRVLNGEATDSYSFVHRLRLASTVMRSLSPAGFSPKHFSVSAGIELFYNAGKEVVNNGFDQMRASANLQYHISSTNTLTAGYLYQVQQFSKGDGYNKLNAVRISFIQQLDLRKNKI